jgi:hypothetical protein
MTMIDYLTSILPTPGTPAATHLAITLMRAFWAVVAVAYFARAMRAGK